MSWPKVDDPPGSPRPGAAAAENLASAEGADQKRALGLGDVKKLAVHFLAVQDEMQLQIRIVARNE